MLEIAEGWDEAEAFVADFGGSAFGAAVPAGTDGWFVVVYGTFGVFV